MISMGFSLNVLYKISTESSEKQAAGEAERQKKNHKGQHLKQSFLKKIIKFSYRIM